MLPAENKTCPRITGGTLDFPPPFFFGSRVSSLSADFLLLLGWGFLFLPVFFNFGPHLRVVRMTLTRVGSLCVGLPCGYKTQVVGCALRSSKSWILIVSSRVVYKTKRGAPPAIIFDIHDIYMHMHPPLTPNYPRVGFVCMGGT